MIDIDIEKQISQMDGRRFRVLASKEENDRFYSAVDELVSSPSDKYPKTFQNVLDLGKAHVSRKTSKFTNSNIVRVFDDKKSSKKESKKDFKEHSKKNSSKHTNNYTNKKSNKDNNGHTNKNAKKQTKVDQKKDSSKGKHRKNTSQKDTSSKEEKEDEKEDEKKLIQCTISIICPVLADDPSAMQEAYRNYIPGDGVLLETSTVTIKEGSSVFDLLKAVCQAKDIRLDAEYSSLYSGSYVRGIGHLYERRAGDMSGWLYKVNGVIPQKGASSYKLKDNDNVVWGYTINGRGM